MVEIAIWTFLPSQLSSFTHLQSRNGCSEKIRRLGFLCATVKLRWRQPYDGFGQALGGSKAHNWLFLWSHGAECTENTSSCSYSTVAWHHSQSEPHRKHRSSGIFIITCVTVATLTWCLLCCNLVTDISLAPLFRLSGVMSQYFTARIVYAFLFSPVALY
jgi:hypothetical protein